MVVTQILVHVEYWTLDKQTHEYKQDTDMHHRQFNCHNRQPHLMVQVCTCNKNTNSDTLHIYNTRPCRSSPLVAQTWSLTTRSCRPRAGISSPALCCPLSSAAESTCGESGCGSRASWRRSRPATNPSMQNIVCYSVNIIHLIWHWMHPRSVVKNPTNYWQCQLFSCHIL